MVKDKVKELLKIWRSETELVDTAPLEIVQYYYECKKEQEGKQLKLL